MCIIARANTERNDLRTDRFPKIVLLVLLMRCAFGAVLCFKIWFTHAFKDKVKFAKDQENIPDYIAKSF